MKWGRLKTAASSQMLTMTQALLSDLGERTLGREPRRTWWRSIAITTIEIVLGMKLKMQGKKKDFSFWAAVVQRSMFCICFVENVLNLKFKIKQLTSRTLTAPAPAVPADRGGSPGASCRREGELEEGKEEKKEEKWEKGWKLNKTSKIKQAKQKLGSSESDPFVAERFCCCLCLWDTLNFREFSSLSPSH